MRLSMSDVPDDGSKCSEPTFQHAWSHGGRAGQYHSLEDEGWRTKAELRRLQPIEVRRLIWEGAALLDARNLEEFTFAHLESALRVEVSAPAHEIRKLLPSLEQPIICYSNGNERGRSLGLRLIDLGYLYVFVLENGIRQFQSDEA
jgi:rhodanese-related sulfurtransferase